MSPIETYIQQLQKRLANRIPSEKLTEVLQETEAHLRSCAEEHGEEGAVIRFGSATTHARRLIQEYGSESNWRAELGVIVACLPCLILVEYAVRSRFVVLVLAVGVLIAGLVGLFRIRQSKPLPLIGAMAASVSCAALLSGALYVHPVHESIRRIDVDRYRQQAFENAEVALAFQTQLKSVTSPRVITAIGTGEFGKYQPVYMEYATIEPSKVGC